VAKAGGLISPSVSVKKVLNFSAPVKLLFSCMTMCDLFFLKRVLRCVGVCFWELYIYILSYGVVYIYVFGMVLFTYLGLHALYIWDVDGFGFLKN
jgi:hypothetical protein